MESIFDLMEGMKKDADEILGKGEKLVEKLSYADDPRFEAERRLNRYDESRKLTDGRIKNTLTGTVTPAPNYEYEGDFPNNVKDENTI